MAQICIQNKWSNITDQRINALINNFYSNSFENLNIVFDDNDKYIIRIQGEKHKAIYNSDQINYMLKRENICKPLYLYVQFKDINKKFPIINFKNIKLFMPNLSPNIEDTRYSNWHTTFIYQAWALRDFIFSDDSKRKYKSFGTLSDPDFIEIPDKFMFKLPHQRHDVIDIKFTIEREEHKIFFVKEDGRKIRISCSRKEMIAYQGFYNRIIDIEYPIITFVQDSEQNKMDQLNIKLNKVIKEHTIQIKETEHSVIQCSICLTNMVNIKFVPCNHYSTCSECCKKLVKNECPLCKKEIISINILTNLDIKNIIDDKYTF